MQRAYMSIYMLLFAITSTLLYFQQLEIARQSFADRGARTAFFARIDLWVNILTFVAQLFLTARVLRGLGGCAYARNSAGAERFRFRRPRCRTDDCSCGRLPGSAARGKFCLRPTDAGGIVYYSAAGR